MRKFVSFEFGIAGATGHLTSVSLASLSRRLLAIVTLLAGLSMMTLWAPGVHAAGDGYKLYKELKGKGGFYDDPQWNAYVRAIACLLYTSPSPRDLSTSRMPSSA